MDLSSLGRQAVALHQQGRFTEAEALYRQILAADAHVFPALYFLGVLRLEQGDAAEAALLLARALALNPNAPEVLLHQGTALGALAQFDKALATYDRLLALQPDLPPALAGRGAALMGLQRLEEALACFDAALRVHPGDLQTRLDRGRLLKNMGAFDAALQEFEAVLVLDSGVAEAWVGRGEALRALRRLDEAQSSFDQAIALAPDMASAWKNRGDLRWTEYTDYTAAMRDLDRAMALDPTLPELPGELLHLRMIGADWKDYDALTARIHAGVRAGLPVTQPFVYQAIVETPADSRACSRLYGQHHFPARTSAPHAPRDTQNGSGRIRIGYVSGEFREQAVSFLMAGLFEQHDRAKFEIIALNTEGPNSGAMRQRLLKAFDKFIDIDQMTDAQAAQRIRDEQIDILVTLNGYFGNPRLGIFARRPAPVQVSYMGFPATLGLPYVDYVLADRITVPEHERQYFDEKVVWLPDTYWVNDSTRVIAPDVPSRADVGLPDDAFVFCNFNNTYKLTPQTFESWLRILGQVPGSVLWLWQGSNPVFADNIRREAQARGIDPQRLVMAGSAEVSANMARLKLADLALDSLPYGAHTTAADVLWTGTPILTCTGSAWPSRVAASLLHAIHLPELVTHNRRDFEAEAVRLAQNPAALKAIKDRLAANRLTTPLFDTVRFARNMEAAYAEMFARWRRGETPDHFAV